MTIAPVSPRARACAALFVLLGATLAVSASVAVADRPDGGTTSDPARPKAPPPPPPRSSPPKRMAG